MSRENTQNASRKQAHWITIALILSVAINGLLAGLVLSKTFRTGPPVQMVNMQPNTGGKMPVGALNDPRRAARHLSETRRKEVLQAAFKQLDLQKEERPRAIFKDLVKAQRETARLARAETVDIAAVQANLDKIRELNAKLGQRTDELVIEIIKQMTPEERKNAFKLRPNLQRQKRGGRPLEPPNPREVDP